MVMPLTTSEPLGLGGDRDKSSDTPARAEARLNDCIDVVGVKIARRLCGKAKLFDQKIVSCSGHLSVQAKSLWAFRRSSTASIPHHY